MSFKDKVINWLWEQVFGSTTPKKQKEQNDYNAITLTVNRMKRNDDTHRVYMELAIPPKRVFDANKMEAKYDEY
ncbi:MAG: hypothetical protein ACFFAS_20420 [Promethearchaeota archaeon]